MASENPAPAGLAERRLARGIGVARAARLAGVHPNTLKAAEAGARPRIDAQKRIADFYGSTVLELWPEQQREAA